MFRTAGFGFSGPAGVLAMAFGALLVVLPGVCDASGMVPAEHGATAAEHAAAEHRHGTDPSLPDVPELPSHEDADHCDAHGCCISTARSTARQVLSIVSVVPVACGVDISVAAAAGAGVVFALPADDAPPGPPGLRTNSPPLRN